MNDPINVDARHGGSDQSLPYLKERVQAQSFRDFDDCVPLVKVISSSLEAGRS